MGSYPYDFGRRRGCSDIFKSLPTASSWALVGPRRRGAGKDRTEMVKNDGDVDTVLPKAHIQTWKC